MQKTQFFLAASFGDLLLNAKQKKSLFSLNNKLSEAIKLLVIHSVRLIC